MSTSALKLYAVPGSPNGQKPAILLKLIGKAYDYYRVDFSANEQKTDWYLKLNPNGKIPTITDTHADGTTTTVFESTTILQYIGEKYDTDRKFYYDLSAGNLYWTQMEWLTFQAAAHSPVHGQAGHFISAKLENPYAKDHFVNETKRVFGVYESRLKENNGWLVGDRLNVADISAFTWMRFAFYAGIDSLEEWPGLKKWVEAIEAVPGVKEGLNPSV